MDTLQKQTMPFIIFLITVIGFAGVFISKQTKLEVQLANIQKELTTISIKLDKRDDELKGISERLARLEARK